MSLACPTCGKTFETPGPRGGAAIPEHECARPGPEEPAADLQALIARSRRSAPAFSLHEGEALDVPPSVREAIRHVEDLLPRPTPAAPVPVRRVRVTAIPVVVLAIAGVVLGAPFGSKRAGKAPHAPAKPEAALSGALVVEALARPPVNPSAAPPPAPPLPSRADPPRSPGPVRPVLRGPGLAAKKGTPAASPSGSAAAAPSPDPPSLMEAIEEAVRSRAAAAERR